MEIHFNEKFKTKGEFECSWYSSKPLDEGDYRKAIWKCLELSSGRY
jgi:hypothetical protein